MGGYTDPQVLELARRHKGQARRTLCARCQALGHGKMVPGVADWGSQLVPPPARADDEAAAEGGGAVEGGLEGTTWDRELLLRPEELRDQLKPLRAKKALVLLLVDGTDFAGSFLNRVRDLVGGNPIVLVVTKADLLPRGTRPDRMREWVWEEVGRRRLTPAEVYLVSSFSGAGVAALARCILRTRRGRDTWVVGAANVGKSALLRALTKEMGNPNSTTFTPAAAAKGKKLPVVSRMPGTTLGPIPVVDFDGGGSLMDTPGLHLPHRSLHIIPPDDVTRLLPRKQLRPFVPPSPGQLQADAKSDAAGLAGLGPLLPSAGSASYFWGGLARIDVLDAPPGTFLVFYSPRSLRVASAPLQDGPTPPGDWPAEVGDGEPLGWAAVSHRGGLESESGVDLEPAPRGDPVAAVDISVAGLPGWVTVHVGGSDLALDSEALPPRVEVWTPRGISAFYSEPRPMDTAYEG